MRSGAIPDAFCVLALLLAGPQALAAVPGEPPLEEIVVTASLRLATLSEFPASVTVLDAGVLRTAGLQHLQDVVGLVPNLSWSGGTSRPRYFLLRGVGELEQYQGAPNPSVGFLIDDIDFSGVGMPATSFDVAQVEVLRGPQGTRYGANALAGLINVRSQAPQPETELRTELSAGEDGLLAAGLVAGGALPGGPGAEGGAWRLAVQQSTSDGFRQNRYLGRDDTNGRDELTLRGRLHLEPAEGWDLGLTVLHADLDNGFDAFAPDNGFDTLSDRPGQDAQRSSGAALRLTGRLDPGTLQSTTALADSDVVYSFDGDWGNDPYWEPYAPYDYFSRYDRERRTLSQDLRLVSTSTAREGGHGWLVGAYAQRLDEENLQRDEFAGELLRPLLTTDYRAVNAALYGEAERALAGLVLSGGLRLETRSADYSDSDGAVYSPRDTMWGGQVSLAGEAGERGHWYLTASRGYKAGGFNIGALVPVDRREFEPEYLWNLEAGLRGSAAEGLLTFDLALFHMWRESQQVATSFQVDPGDPLSYVFYTDNAARGRNAGLEATLAWQALPELALGATLGLLHSEYLGYRYGDRDLDGREQAHAPGWQYSLSAEWNAGRGWLARADLMGSDAFYFDASHDQRSRPYALLNLKAGYAGGRWAVFAWGRNVTDERHAVRGFYFGLEPPDYADRLYVQQGDPRQFGLTLQWSLR